MTIWSRDASASHTELHATNSAAILDEGRGTGVSRSNSRANNDVRPPGEPDIRHADTVASTSQSPQAIGLRYRYLLGTILLVFLLIIAIPADFVGAPLRIVVLAGLLQMTLRMRRRSGKFARPAAILSALLLIATALAALFGSPKVLAVIAQSATVLLVAAAIAVLADTLRQSKVVNGSVVRGVLSVYLLIALLFAAIDELGANLTSHYLHGVMHATASNTLYFSIITITTVGYGDITPGNSFAQAIAAAEALVGQLYLVSVVAVVVSRYRSTDKTAQGNG
jgi:hypothetical protein